MGTGFELLDHYPAPPGCCSFCRGANVPVIDTGILEEDLLAALPEELRGHVYLCHQCANDVVQVIGGVPAATAERIKAEKAELEAEVAELRDEVARYAAMARSMALALPESEHEEVAAARLATLDEREKEALSGAR